MQQAGELYAKNAASKDGQFHSQAALAAAKLLRAQVGLEQELKRPAGEFQGLSVADTIAKCVILGHAKGANAIRNDLKVSDKHFCWIRLRALAAKRDWEGVVALADEKKPPIGCAGRPQEHRAAGAPSSHPPVLRDAAGRGECVLPSAPAPASAPGPARAQVPPLCRDRVRREGTEARALEAHLEAPRRVVG